jgi:hypothetical protein
MKNRFSALLLALGLAITTSGASAEQPADPRHDLGFTAQERAVFLADMRNMLASIQGVLLGIGENDRAVIAAAARESGNRMARATPASIRAKIPQSFKDIGGPTHLAFEELALRAETDEMDALARQTAAVMQKCAACHAMFRVH